MLPFSVSLPMSRMFPFGEPMWCLTFQCSRMYRFGIQKFAIDRLCNKPKDSRSVITYFGQTSEFSSGCSALPNSHHGIARREDCLKRFESGDRVLGIKSHAVDRMLGIRILLRRIYCPFAPLSQ